MSVTIASRGPKIAIVNVKGETKEVLFDSSGLANVDKATAKELIKKNPKSYFYPGKGSNSLDLADPLQILNYGLNQLVGDGKYGVAKNWLMQASNKVETAVMNADRTQVDSDDDEHGLKSGEMQTGPTMIRLPGGQEIPIDQTDVDGKPKEEEDPEELDEDPDEDEDDDGEEEEEEETGDDEDDDTGGDSDDNIGDDNEEHDEEDELLKDSKALAKKGKKLSEKKKKKNKKKNKKK